MERVAASFRDGTASAEELDDAIASLEEVLLPHLRAEESEAMPHVGVHMTEKDWNNLANKAWRKGPLKEGAFAVNWLLDNADADGRAVFLDTMPAPVTFLFLRVLAGAYAERRRALWEGTVAEDVPPTR